MEKKIEAGDLQGIHDHVMEEIARVAKIDDPSVLQCDCGPKQVCKVCPPAKKIAYLEHARNQNAMKRKHGPRKLLVEADVTPDSLSSQKKLKRRMAELKQVAEKKLGYKLTNREFREITEKMAKEIYDKEQKEKDGTFVDTSGKVIE